MPASGVPASGVPASGVHVNPLAGELPALEVPALEVLDFHRRLPGYAATPLLSLPSLAAELGIGSLLAKCESERFGLPAFKMLGASWATYRAVRERLGRDPEPWTDLRELAKQLEGLLPFALAAATDGNHGRAVARMAHLLGFGARIFVPEGTTPNRIDAIASEGADVVVVPGGYDAAVARSAEEAGPRCLVISDTSWPGYMDVPRWVIEGYATLFGEIDEALARSGREAPDVVVVPIGVGALAAAAVAHFGPAPPDGSARSGTPSIVGVEPQDAACVTASALAGRLVTLEGGQHSIMVGLNCGTPSLVAWPLVSRGVAGFVTVGDDWARRAVRDLAAAGIEAGETGAAALAGLRALREAGGGPGGSPLAGLLTPGASVLVLVTEGASDVDSWRRILGVEVVGEPTAG